MSYSYDALSRLTQVSDPSGTYSFGYDNLGRLTGTATSYSFLSRTLTMSYAYDAGSNRVSFTDPESGLTSYTYDSLNRLTGLTDFNGGAFTFSYDALGRRTSLARPNAVTTSYAYDSLSRLLSILHQSSAFTAGTGYTYDAVGNRTSRTDTSQVTGQNPAQSLTNYSYDSIYELTQAVLNGTTTETYSFDGVGNRTSSLGVPSYTYNSSNELTSAGSKTFTYDANGNTLTKATPSGTTSYVWDFENRLSSVSLPNGGVVHFKYDPFGRRIFVYDGDNIIEDLDLTGKSVARYTQGLGIDEPLEVSQSGVPAYYEADGLGSVTSLTDPTASIANTYTYNSFGITTATTGAVSNRFQYTARENVPKAGLYYYRARYYDPGVGRFLTQDPGQRTAGISRLTLIPSTRTSAYPYADNNPVVDVDPFGEAPQSASNGADIGACKYYDDVAKQFGCKYHGGSGAFFCRHPNFIPRMLFASTTALNSVRKCLIDEEKKARNDPRSQPCGKPGCVKRSRIVEYHKECFNRNGLSPAWFPSWTPFSNDGE